MGCGTSSAADTDSRDSASRGSSSYEDGDAYYDAGPSIGTGSSQGVEGSASRNPFLPVSGTSETALIGSDVTEAGSNSHSRPGPMRSTAQSLQNVLNQPDHLPSTFNTYSQDCELGSNDSATDTAPGLGISRSDRSDVGEQDRALSDPSRGVRALRGRFTVSSTLTEPESPTMKAVRIRNYAGGGVFEVDDQLSVFFPSVDERHTARVQEVNHGSATGKGLLWPAANRNYVPVPLDIIPVFPNKGYLNPAAKDSILAACRGISDDLQKIEPVLGKPADYESAFALAENLFMRAKAHSLHRLTSVFLELFTRIRDMIVLKRHPEEFFAAVDREDLNHFHEAFFSSPRSGGQKDGMFQQFVEQELAEIIVYCVCVAYTTIDDVNEELARQTLSVEA